MKKIIQTALTLLFLLPLGLQAQSVVTKELYEGTQILNSDFETWKDDNGNDQKEPRYWHSFVSATGSLAGQARGTVGSSTTSISGSYSCQLKSGSIFGIVNNGTMSTGRLNAGNMSASNPANNASLDISRTDTDNYGDLFFSSLTKRPTALAVWVKFTQGTANSEYPFATISAAITNGSYYQEPTADNDSSAVIGYAQNKKIRSNDGEWQHLYIPFSYDSGNFNHDDEPQAIMVTFSTNAEPGKGSSGDILLIDNLELIYTQQVEIPDCRYFAFTNVAQENHAVVMPDDLIGYALGLTADGNPIVTKTYKPGEVIPAGESLLLEGNPGYHTFKTTLYETGESPVLNDKGKLVDGTEFNNAVAGYKYFHLTSDVNGNAKFVEATTGLKIMRGKSLLRVKADLAADSYPHVLVTPAKAGDIDDNGNVDATDVKALVNRLLGNQQGMTKFLIPDADVNGDKSTNVADVTELVNILINE